uniref:BTB domain-containing protein n=1 Tax=Panagrolaimus sp. PS1159 TaxID=55785 RepID=A0AC35F6Y5_9BILA
MKFKYYVKKITEKTVEVCIENPYNVDIYDVNKSVTAKVDEFRYESAISNDINLKLAFVFDPSDCHRGTNFSTNSNTNQDYDHNALYEIMSNPNYADVILFSSSGKEIPTYRCVLAKYSTFFEKCFEESKEFPVKFRIKEFDTETIKSALDFCYGKKNSIEGNEAKLFDFASKYSFIELMKACSNSFEKTVNEKNVCEIIQIAYSTENESLKQKCHKIFAENKGKIDSTEVKKLPHDILVNVFFV